MPNPRTALVLGIFNVNFAILLMICSLVSSASLVVMPFLTNAMAKVQEDAKKQVEQQRKDRLAALDEDAKTAKTEQEKKEIETRRLEIENKPGIPVTPMLDLSDMGLDDPKVLGWWWTELGTGIVVNLMMLASGIGLLYCKTWSWKLGFWMAILKILRLTVVYAACIIVVIPAFSQKMGAAVSKMMVQQQAIAGRSAASAPPPELFVKVYSVMYSGMAVGMIVMGSIYPLVVIWTLTRPGVRAACFPYQPPKPSTEPAAT